MTWAVGVKNEGFHGIPVRKSFGVVVIIIAASICLYVISKRPPLPMPMPIPKTIHRDAYSDGLDIVLAFPPMNNKDFVAKAGYFTFSAEKLKERELEYVDCLRRNLQHPAVSHIHILNQHPDDLRKLLNVYKIDTKRVRFVNASEDVTYAELFSYVSKTLQDHFVNIMNADMYIGEGFSQLDWLYLRNTRVMYSLTRKHMKPIPKGCGYNENTLGSYCENGSEYIGSHDCYLYYVNSQLPVNFLKELDHKINAYGGENLVIWAFMKLLNFTVLNPCKVLFLYHHHCSNVRTGSDKYRKRVNVDGKSGTASFTDNLHIDGKS